MNYDEEISAAMLSQVAAGVCSAKDFVGCSEKEILEVEHSLNVSLPEAYKSFLRLMGKSSGILFLGTDHFYPGVMRFRQGYREILRDENIATDLISSESIIIGMHQGYLFYFIQDIHTNDPPVYVCDVTENQCKKVTESFTKYVHEYTELFLDAAPTLQKCNVVYPDK
jgi:hypothetical protein